MHIVGLAADLSDNYIFWTDLSSQNFGIWRSRLNTQSTPTQILNGNAIGIKQPTGLAVDWINKVLYWTDAGLNTVEISNYDGGNRRVIITHGLDIPRGIVSDPVNGYLYIGDQGTHQILRCKLDGKNCMVWKSSNETDVVYWPNQLSINYNTGRLYWTDGFISSVASCNLDGTACSKLKATGSVFGLSVPSTGGQIYYSTLNNRTLSRFDSSNNPISVLTTGGESRSYFMVSSDKDATQPNGNSPCSGIVCTGGMCVPHDSTTYYCACPSYSAKVLVNNNRCESTDEFLIFSDAEAGEVGMMSSTFNSVNANGHPTTLIARALNPVAVTYDTENAEVFFSDIGVGTIEKVKLDGTGKMEILNRSYGIDQVEGLALDTKQRRLYFSNRGYMDDTGVAFWHRIEMIDLNNRKRRTIVTDVDKPRGLFIDSVNRHLYYTDWGISQKVGQTNLDGFNKADILTQSNAGLERPNGITIINNRLYTVDSKLNFNNRYTFVNSSVDGSGIVQTTISKSMVFPFGITGNSQRIYISDADSENSKLIVYDMSSAVTTEVNFGFKKLTGIQFVKKSLNVPPNDGVCADSSNPCQNGVCFTKSDQTKSTCLCQSNKLNYLAEDRKTCKVPTSYILVADVDGIKMASLESSDDTHVYTLIHGTQSCGDFRGLTVDQTNNKIYFSGSDSGLIYSANLDGTNIQDLNIEQNTRIVNIASDAGSLYWTGLYGCNDTSGGIFSWKIGSTASPREIIQNVSQPNAVAVNGRYIYWSEQMSQIKVYDLVNEISDTVDVRHSSNVESLNVDNDGHLYISYSDGQLVVRKFPKDSYKSDLVIVEGTSGATSGIFVSGKYVYLTSDNSVIQFDRVTKLNKTEVGFGYLSRPGQIVVIGEKATIQQQGREGKLGTCEQKPRNCSYLQCSSDGTCPGNEKCCYSDISYSCSMCEGPIDSNLCTLTLDGQSIFWSRDNKEKYTFDCMECDCDNPVCTRIGCPVLQCPQAEQDLVGCCPVCTSIKQCSQKPTIQGCPTDVKEVTLAADMSYVPLDENLLSLENLRAYSCDNQPVSPMSELNPNRVKWSADLQKVVTSAEDKHGKSDCEISVRVRDVTKPVFTYCPTESLEVVTTSDKVKVEWQLPIAEDNSGYDPVITDSGYKNGELFPPGFREVKYIATDGAGNKANCTFSVNVIKEVFSCPDPPVIQNGYLQCKTSNSVTRCSIDKCHRGYVQLDENEKTYECTGNGEWNPPFPDLFDVKTCFKPEPLEVILPFVVALINCPHADFTEADVLDCLSLSNLCPAPESKISLCESKRLTKSGYPNVNLRWNTVGKLEFGNDLDTFVSKILETNTKVLDFFLTGTYENRCPRIACKLDKEETKTERQEQTRCPEGSKLHQNIRGQQACAPCSPGTKYLETDGTGACEKCKIGFYQTMAGQLSCESCQQGKTTSEEASFLESHCSVPRGTEKPPTPPSSPAVIIAVAVSVSVIVIIIIILTILFCYCRRQSAIHKANVRARYEQSFEPKARASEFYDTIHEKDTYNEIPADTYNVIPADLVSPYPPNETEMKVGNDGYVTPKDVSDEQTKNGVDPYLKLGDAKSEMVDYQGLKPTSPYEKLVHKEDHSETYVNPLFKP